MFNRKQNEIDRLNYRCIELSRELRQTNIENNDLKKLRIDAVIENTKLLKIKAKQDELLTEIADRVFSCPLDSEKIVLDKIKELVRDYQSIN